MDHMMPDMDGVETYEQLRSDGLIGNETAVIAMTANAVTGARDTYLSYGFEGYLSKPIVQTNWKMNLKNICQRILCPTVLRRYGKTRTANRKPKKARPKKPTCLLQRQVRISPIIAVFLILSAE